MPEFVITDYPHDPSCSALWLGVAEDPVEALDLFAEGEGFVPYSELPDEDGQPWFHVYDEATEGGYVASAIFTNHEVFVFMIDHSDADILRKIDAGTAFDAATENRLEAMGLIRQTDRPYAEITEAGRALMTD